MKLVRFFLILLAVTNATGGARGDWDIHVSEGGTSEADGTAAKPFPSLSGARDAIREARKLGKISPTEPVVVHLAPGIYPLDATFELGPEDGGTEGAPVVYRRDGTGDVTLQGGLSLSPSRFSKVSDPEVLSRLDESVRDRILVMDLSDLVSEALPPFRDAYHGAPAAPWLYVNGEPMTLARWPNLDESDGDDWARFSKAIDSGKPDPAAADPEKQKSHAGAFEFDDDRPARWRLDDGVWLFGYWTHDWSYEVIRIAGYDRGKKIIRLAAPHSYGIGGGTWGGKERRFFALNTLDELDAPGEWYLDRIRKRLYFYPQASWPDAKIVLASLTKPLVEAKGTKHVRFEGLDFEYGHGPGIVLRDTENVEIAGCTVANLAGSGISVSGGGRNTIRSCDLFNLGAAGLTLSGGDRQTLTPADNVAENNHIHHYGRFQRTYAPGIGAYGCGQIVRHNRIHDAPHNAVLYGGNEHLFEDNEIFRVVMETGDSGAFYTGRDWTSQGNVLRHNYIHDLGAGNEDATNTMGVYLDDCDSGDTIEGNVFLRAGRAIMIGGGRDNRVINNLVVDCPIGLHLDSRGMTWKQWNDPNSAGWNLEEKAEKLNYRKPPWSERYPSLAKIMSDSPREPLHNVIRNNVFVDCGKEVANLDANVRKLIDKLDIDNNLAVSRNGEADGKQLAEGIKGFQALSGTEEKPVDLGFVDEKGGHFGLKPGAGLKTALPAFQPIPIDKIGLFRDQFRKDLP
ncbi:MAG: right-handed parallel beta-helix repeat-containing protein [Verrucomicrobiae bacterium]|nr:right-handed parallel beta-helix repeat-containing protein [Verrucomicrobiae bacterium]